MALKKIYQKKDDIPEALRALYREADGKFVLDLDDEAKPDDGGGDAAAKVREMREKNIALNKQLSELQGKLSAFGDADAETVKAALAALSTMKNNEEADLVKAGKLDDVVRRRTEAMQAQFQKQMADITKKLEQASKRESELLNDYGGMRLRAELTKALDEKKVRVRQGALDDLLLRAERTFKLNPEDRSLQTAQVGNDPSKPLTVGDWVGGLVETAGHLFEGGEGGGTKPGGGGAGGVRHIPRASVSPTEFAKIAGDVASGKVVLT